MKLEVEGVEVARAAAAAERARTESDHRYSRRRLLAGLGASAAFLPLLSAHQARGAAAASPKRFVFVQWTNGVLTKHFWPSGGESSFTLNDCTMPLAPYQKDILILRGIDLKSAKADPFCGAGHASLPHLLTGSKSASTNITGGDPGSRGIGNAISVDQYIANAFASNQPTPIKSLQLGIMTGSPRPTGGYISFRGPAKNASYPDADRPESNPYNSFKTLFQGGMLPAATIDKLRFERKSVLDVVGKNITRLSKTLGTDDRERIQEHLSAVQTLESELATLGQASSGAAADCGGAALTPAGINLTDHMHYGDIAKLTFDLITLAFKCDVTRVATVMFSDSADTQITFAFLGGSFTQASNPTTGVASGTTIGHHEIAHAAGDGDSAQKITVDNWFVGQFATLIDRFKKTPSPSGGVLFDQSLLVFSNHMGIGAAHNLDNVPVIMAGSAGGYYKTGRYISLGDVAHNGMLASFANAMGVPTTSFGDPSFNTFAQIDPKLRGV